MDVTTLRHFYTLAQEGSFSNAAKKLHYAQSNLSARIKQLENELQSQLFYRHPYGVSLTRRGEILFRYVERILQLLEETENAVRNGTTAKGTLHIGTMESAAISFLPNLLGKYHNLFPAIRIRVQTGVSQASLRKVLSNELDGAFVAGPTDHTALNFVTVRKERLVLLTDTSVGNTITSEELLRRPLLVLPQGCFYRKVLERWLDDIGIFSSSIIEFDALGAIIASVSAGLGVAFIPESAVKAFTTSGALRSHAVPDCYGIVPVHFVWHESELLDSGLKSFIEIVKNSN